MRFAFQAALWTICLILLNRDQVAYGQLSITANDTYAIGFDATVAGVNNGPYAGAGFQPLPGPGQLDSDAWCIHWNPTNSLNYGGTQTTEVYAQGPAVGAPVTFGGFYAFSGGNISTGVALGIQPDGNGFNASGEDLTLRVRNDTGHFVTYLDLSYLLYVRNDQPHATKFNFSYSSDDVNYTNVSSSNYTSPAIADALGFVSNSKAAPISSLAVPNGGYIYLRWSCSDGNVAMGLRDEFALDDITVTNFVLADGIPTRGDVNQDNSIDVADVRSLTGALADLDAFQTAHSALAPSQVSLILDINQDSVIDNLDVQELISLVANSTSSGGGQLHPVPEPATLALTIVGALLVGIARWRSQSL